MALRTLPMTPELAEYVIAHSSALSPVAKQLIQETAALGAISRMQISPEEGQLLSMLVRISGAKQVLEIGTFTGFSALMMVEGGATQVTCLDVSREWTDIARRYWKEAGIAGRIDLKIGPAVETLEAMSPNERFDFVFIDADKPSYPIYFEKSMDRVRPGGLIAVDNTLWSGQVVDRTDNSEDTAAIRSFNDMVAADRRVDVVIVPVADGLTLIRKRD
jgi:caffeoyl-CoA O-methyltransferase